MPDPRPSRQSCASGTLPGLRDRLDVLRSEVVSQRNVPAVDATAVMWCDLVLAGLAVAEPVDRTDLFGWQLQAPTGATLAAVRDAVEETSRLLEEALAGDDLGCVVAQEVASLLYRTPGPWQPGSDHTRGSHVMAMPDTEQLAWVEVVLGAPRDLTQWTPGQRSAALALYSWLTARSCWVSCHRQGSPVDVADAVVSLGAPGHPARWAARVPLLWAHLGAPGMILVSDGTVAAEDVQLAYLTLGDPGDGTLDDFCEALAQTR